jgi:8-oxo-dGTP diphosphatase/2-hydroxy-dATP diphosphatase
MKKILTLCIIHQRPRILLGMKKRGFGEGRWNGFGGKVGADESIEDAARREVREEASIEVSSVEKLGILEFSFARELETILEVHIFKAKEFTGEPMEGEEMKPQWFDENNIPFNDMWPDDKFWFPLFLTDKKFHGSFLFGEGDSVLKQRLEEVENL